MALKTPGSVDTSSSGCLSAGELGDGLGALRDGVLSELTGENQSDGSLDLARAEHSLSVVSDQATSLRSDLLEGVVDQRVQDRDGSLADSDLGVNLLEDSDNVSAVRLHSLVVSLDDLLVRLCNDFLDGHVNFKI